jgi:hypothetical protein
MSGHPEAESKVQDLLEAWRTEPIDPASLGVQDQQQLQQVVKALRGVALAREGRRRFRRVAAALAVAAGALGVAVGGWVVGQEQASPPAPALAAATGVRLAESEGDLLLLDSAGQPLARSERLGAGATLETRQGGAALEFPSGARARAAQLTRVGVKEAGGEQREALVLARGEVDVEVPKLAQPIEFSVQTPDALVVVHGTRFSVRVDPDAPAGAITHVAVTHGLVAVHAGGGEVWLSAGQDWPPTAKPAAAERAAVVDPEPAAAPRDTARVPSLQRHRARRAAVAARARQPRLDAHSLAAENRVFAAAMAKHKAGDLSGALLEIERLLREYPGSVLVQEARVERFRLLHGLGRVAEAARQARSYLGDYHDGYAREEARSIALENP